MWESLQETREMRVEGRRHPAVPQVAMAPSSQDPMGTADSHPSKAWNGLFSSAAGQRLHPQYRSSRCPQLSELKGKVGKRALWAVGVKAQAAGARKR